MPIKHYKHGGSTAARQLECPAWTSLAEGTVRVGVESEYAKVGTALHAVMEGYLDSDEDVVNPSPEALIGEDIEGVILDEDHAELIREALTALDSLEDTYFPDDDNTEYLVEQTFSLNEDIGGTADLIVFDDTQIHIIDWKFGQGVAVSPDNSAQGMFYAMVAEHELPDIFKDRNLYIDIIQPMPSRDTNTLKTWKVPAKTFTKFKRDYMASLSRATLKTGKHCQFCPCAPICPKKTGAAKKAVLIDPKDTEKLNDNLKLAAELKTWCDEVLAFGHSQLDEGLKLQDWKLVPKRAIRKWYFEDSLTEGGLVTAICDAASVGKVDVYSEPKLKSPAQVEKMLKAEKVDLNVLSDYIIKESSGTTMAPADDPRQGIPSTTSLAEAVGRLEN